MADERATRWVTRTRALQLGGVLLVAGAAALLLRPERIAVETARVGRGPLTVAVEEEGETRVRDRFVVAAPVAGRLQRIALDPGDAVNEGMVVARMNPLPLDPRAEAEARARLESAEAAKREADARQQQAAAAVAQAKREAERARTLERAGTISRSERERADLELETNEKQVEAALFAARAAEFNVVAARAALIAAGSAGRDGGVLELVSPIEGSVLRVLEESERTVAFGTPLLELGDPGSLEIVVDVLTRDAVRVRPGAPMRIEDWGGEPPLEARVRLIEPSAFTKISALGVEEQRVNVIGDFEKPAPLGDGYRVEVAIEVWHGDDVLQIPSSALFRWHGEWNVFALENGVARRRALVVGQSNPEAAEVRQGLAEGEVVILHPSDEVADGVRVRAVGE